jgi:Ca-activated chloride channel family protein
MSAIRTRVLRMVMASLIFFVARQVWAQAPSPPSADRTLSPYLVVERGDPSIDRLPLQSTKVEIAVANVIADVSVTQVYKNDGQRRINARYVFPASTRAAVHGMRMAIGKQVIEAQIQERKKAAQTFQQAKQAGKSASLLEEERPNVFSMSVANVLPGDRIEITLRYTELIVPTEGVYEFVYPTVVGPRYSGQSEAAAPASHRWVKQPYLPEGQGPTSSLELSGTLSSAIPVQSLESPSHQVARNPDNPNFWRFSLAGSEQRGNNRDFILRYRLAGDVIQSGLMLYPAAQEKFFLLQVQPPARVKSQDLPAREYVLVVDVSGSMSGFPLETAKGLLRDLVSGLRPTDKFNLLLFSGGSTLMSPQSLPATQENVTRALALLGEQQGGGGTELLPALERALKLSPEKGLSRSFLIITDGYVAADREAIQLIRAHLGEANAFAFGIGSSVNRYLVEGIAKAGWGEPFVVTDPSQAASVARRFRDYVAAPVLTNVQVIYRGLEVYEVEPRAIPDVMAERPVVVIGKWRGAAQGSITVRGVSGRGPYEQRFELEGTSARAQNRALAYLWARTRISHLVDFGFGTPTQEEEKTVTALGLGYNLLTPFTSFVAVSQAVRAPGGSATDVEQPLPLPMGVTNAAVGTPITSASEPEPALLLALLLSMLGLGRLLAYRIGSVAR